MSEADFLKNYNIHDYDVPLFSVDMCIFAIIEKKLNVLLVQRDEYPSKGQWALPGGFIDLKKDASVDDTAYRKLLEKTGVKTPYLEQVATKGSPKRDPRGWSITTLYYALIDYSKVKALTGKQQTQWISIDEIKQQSLAFDHANLLTLAHERLQAKVTYTALPIELLPKEFTLTELQRIFEIILQRKLPIKSFRRRIESADLIINTGKSKQSGKRTAQLFKHNGKGRDYIFNRPIATE